LLSAWATVLRCFNSMVFVRFQILLMLLSVYSLPVRPAPHLPSPGPKLHVRPPGPPPRPTPYQVPDPPLLCVPSPFGPVKAPSGPLNVAPSAPPCGAHRLAPSSRPPSGPISLAVGLRQPPPYGPVSSSQLTTINSFRCWSPVAFLV
jgi:hypothetical protein